MSLTSVSSVAAPGAPAVAGAASGAGTEQRFLKLLVSQLNNQDPLNPMDNAQLTSQLAQLSTVSGIEQMNTTLQSLVRQGGTGQMLQAAGMVGRVVLSPGNRIVAAGAPADFAVDLSGPAASVKAIVVNAAGNAVRTMDLGSLAAGTHAQQWDGRDDAGEMAPAGVYSLQVAAANGSAPVNAATLVTDRVASVSSGDAGVPALTLATGTTIGLSDVRRVY